MLAAWLLCQRPQPQRSELARAHHAPFASQHIQNACNPFPERAYFSGGGQWGDFYCPLRTQIRPALTEYVSGEMGVFRGIESKKQELCGSVEKSNYTRRRRYSERALGRWRRGVVGTRLFCTLRNMFRGPCCEREKKQKGAKNVLLHFRRPVHRPHNSAAFKIVRRYTPAIMHSGFP